MLKMLANQNGYRQQALCVSDASLEGFSREYQRGDSLESFSGVFLWRDVLRYHTACVTGRCISGIPEITIVGPHFFDAAVKKTRNKSGQRSSLPAAHRDVNKPDY